MSRVKRRRLTTMLPATAIKQKPGVMKQQKQLRQVKAQTKGQGRTRAGTSRPLAD
jgi:hypothetical protein